MTRKQLGKVLMVVYVLVMAFTIFLVIRLGMPRSAQVQKIGFIMAGESADQSSGAYKGVRSACEELGVELLLREGVSEFDGSCPRAVDELAKEGAEMIILSSASYSQEMEPLYERYPGVTFYGIFASASSFDVPNLTSYSTRMYQARYLSGIVAGMYTESGGIGFVATEASSEVCRNINAFALGVRRVAPRAEVIVAWTDIDGSEEEAARKLIEKESVDVITYHQNQSSVIAVAEKAGVASIGYYDHVDNLSDRYLTCAACDWEMLYRKLIQEYLRGQSSSVINDWLGLESGAVGLTKYSPMVSQAAINEVEKATQEILSGRDVFTGEILDNQGKLRCGAGESMTDETLMRRVDWLVKGVRVYEQN